MAVATHSRTERAIELFHALSDETRLEIIELLRKGERCVCELTDTLDAAQSRLSFHLRVLKESSGTGRTDAGFTTSWIPRRSKKPRPWSQA